MDDDQNGGAAVVARPHSSDTCGMIVNHDVRAAAAAAAATAATAVAPAALTTSAPYATAAAVAATIGVPARPALPYGVHLNNNNNNSVVKGQQQLKGPGNPDHRNRRPRRGKRKSKKSTPYTKDGMMFRLKALAPNNTNQFLMEDHNVGPDIDKKLSARYNENGRKRNSSYTSVESDGEQIYSSSDDDGTSIQKEFIDTYRLVQEEELDGLTKNELTQRVIELEEKVQMLESKRFKKNNTTYLNGISKEEDEDSIDLEEYRSMQIKIRELTTQNKILQSEIETLKQSQKRTIDSESSMDTESSSDSSSSSSSSEGHSIEMKFSLRRSGRDDDHTPNVD